MLVFITDIVPDWKGGQHIPLVIHHELLQGTQNQQTDAIYHVVLR